MTRALACLFAAAFLAGCGGYPIVAPPGTPSIAMPAAAQHGDLLYVSDYETNDVYAYSYPEGKRVGVLAGILKDFVYPTGLCTDDGGDLFIPDSANASVLEYAHGGSRPVAQLVDANEYPYSCAIDPTTGNLAVVNLESFHAGGSVSIYAHASGRPAKYSYPYIFKWYFAAYDDQGNLFVDASYDAPSAPFVFLELPKGRKSFRNVTLDQAFRMPGAIAWDGRHLAVADSKSSVISRFSIRRSVGKRVGSLKLSDARRLGEFSIVDGNVVGASFHGGDVDLWKYPRGGAPENRLTGFGEPFGLALSRASRPHAP